MKLGINGLGRIGKLSLWHHIARRHFTEAVVNIGREAGFSLQDLIHYVEHDSTYGTLGAYLHGQGGKVHCVRCVDEADGLLEVEGVTVRILRGSRNPSCIGWRDHDVRLVVDTTGAFLDPTVPEEEPSGCLRGHFLSGADKVIVSAPFKIKDKSRQMPEDAVTTVMGVNETDWDPRRHRILSNASCTTTCLAHMIKPLLDALGHKKILTASMATVHAATGSQQVLDRLPKAGATDLRKNRSVLNNIILTTTGAATTLGLVLPQMRGIGFIAESVRIPTSTGSLIILVVNLQDVFPGEGSRRDLINGIYREAARRDARGYLQYTEEQNVSCDIMGLPRAACLIEAHETHTRTAQMRIDLAQVPGIARELLEAMEEPLIPVRVTQAVIYGWYDNEMGSYVNLLGDRTVTVAQDM